MNTPSVQIPSFGFFDIIVLVILVLFFFRGFKKGFTREILSLVGFLLGLFFASRLFHDAAILIDSNVMHLKNSSTLELLGFIVVFVVVWVSAILLGAIFGKLESANGISFINHIFGAITGALKAFVVLSFFFLLVSNTLLDQEKVASITRGSLLYPWMQSVGVKINSIRPSKHISAPNAEVSISQENNYSNPVPSALPTEN